MAKCRLKTVRAAFVRQSSRFHNDEEGQLVFVGIFGSVGIVLMLAMFLNMSANLHEKMRMQNAADAACLAAAQEIADGMNIISDNNVAITEFLALKSLSEAMVPMAESLFPSHDQRYLDLLEALEDNPDLWEEKERYRKARNLEELIPTYRIEYLRLSHRDRAQVLRLVKPG